MLPLKVSVWVVGWWPVEDVNRRASMLLAQGPPHVWVTIVGIWEPSRALWPPFLNVMISYFHGETVSTFNEPRDLRKGI